MKKKTAGQKKRSKPIQPRLLPAGFAGVGPALFELRRVVAVVPESYALEIHLDTGSSFEIDLDDEGDAERVAAQLQAILCRVRGVNYGSA